jgi:hypothetical protein
MEFAIVSEDANMNAGNPNQLMFASCYPPAFPIKDAIEALENVPGLIEEFKRKMFFENAARFYGFE